ncbi:MAG: LysM peptidoglycan-binding domain-containing protein [Thiohalorhabdus sp.]|uniref:LysM peptidoglycan-binding domain-containing protein n=1 Tax=Thiohalorhabdus sp. TaxID=3094134 RepID=UPI00397F4407
MNRTNRRLCTGGLALGVSLILGGCASQPTEEGGQLEDRAAQAVSQAEDAVQTTRQETNDTGLWKSTLGILDDARSSLEDGEYEEAIDAAEEASFEAEQGLEQYRKEQEQHKEALKSAENSGDFPEGEWVGSGGDRTDGDRKSVANGTLEIESDTEGRYQVGGGDTLWDIAAADAIYGDPFAWPLIYKSNSREINDPDLIFPDQELEIEWGVDDASREAAIEHAKNRGSWRLGEPESSDLEYLESN